jgi:cytochrome P450
MIELFDPMRPETLKNPYPAYAALREHGPVAFLEPLNIWVVSRYAEVGEVLAAPEAFSAALAFGRDSSLRDARTTPARQLNLKFAGESGGVVSSTDGAVHTRLRRMVAKILSKPQLDAAEDGIRDHVRKLVAALAADRREFDVVSELAKPVAAKAIGGLMGLSDDVAMTLASWVDLTFRALDPGDELSAESAGPRIMRSNLASIRILAAFLSASDNAQSGLVEAWSVADTPAAREEVILSVLQLFQAGYETIVSAVCYILVAFVIDRAESPLRDVPPEVFATVVDEGLRLASPVRATVRTAVGDQAVGGAPVPDGAMVMLLLGSANRDERVFPAPDRVRLGRQTPHVAFGAGPHRCLGRALAQRELRHLLGTLLESTTRISAVGGARVAANVLKASYDYLPVRVDWR